MKRGGHAIAVPWLKSQGPGPADATGARVQDRLGVPAQRYHARPRKDDTRPAGLASVARIAVVRIYFDQSIGASIASNSISNTNMPAG